MISLLLTLLATAPDAGQPPVLPELRRLATKLEPTLEHGWVKAWLGGVTSLQPVKPATWYCSKAQQKCVDRAPADASFLPRVVDDDFVYARITDPLGYARAFELLAADGFEPKGKKVLDFGYGNLGQLLMLQRLGVEVHGVEVDPLLPLAGKSFPKLKLHHGYFAKDTKLVAELGTGFDLFLSKNTLKRGYVHPEVGTAQIDLGLPDDQVLALIFKQLKPGGRFLIYNLAPAQTEPYKPMADGRSPWSRAQLEAAGFEVIAFDVDDSEKARAMGHALEWDLDGAPLEKSLFATWTLAKRP